ncbi:hypothetical protein YC2023_028286 [Brassica napus]
MSRQNLNKGTKILDPGGLKSSMAAARESSSARHEFMIRRPLESTTRNLVSSSPSSGTSSPSSIFNLKSNEEMVKSTNANTGERVHATRQSIRSQKNVRSSKETTVLVKSNSQATLGSQKRSWISFCTIQEHLFQCNSPFGLIRTPLFR